MLIWKGSILSNYLRLYCKRITHIENKFYLILYNKETIYEDINVVMDNIKQYLKVRKGIGSKSIRIDI